MGNVQKKEKSSLLMIEPCGESPDAILTEANCFKT